MSIIVLGMEMPKNCYDCPLAMQDYTTLFGKNYKQTRNSYSCVLTHKSITSTKRNRFCPLIPVPPHGRLIDGDRLERRLEAVIPHWVTEEIQAAPTIIEAEKDGAG